MAGQVFNLKVGNTRPILQVTLKNPDGTAFDLTGITSRKLRILLSNGTVLERDMELDGTATLGKVMYTWLSSDWAANQLVAGPSLPLKPGEREHQMEYEMSGGSTVMTWPNDGHDILRITEALD